MDMQSTKEGFEDLVEESEGKGLNRVLAIYKALDVFLEEAWKNSGERPACKKGCSACCFQMVVVTKSEMDAIMTFLGANRPVRRALQLRMRKSKILREWERYLEKLKSDILVSLQDIQGVYRDWFGKTHCPFLEKDACSIYPVRPIDCRTYSSTERCSSGKLRVVRFRFQSELWANNMLMEYAQLVTGAMGVTPILHFLYEWERLGQWNFGPLLQC